MNYLDITFNWTNNNKSMKRDGETEKETVIKYTRALL